jgi:hypothetical protein
MFKTRKKSRVRLVGAVALFALLGLIAFLLYSAREESLETSGSSAQEAAEKVAEDLAGLTVQVDMTILVEPPGSGGEVQRLSGAGAADFASGLAQVTYDFSDILNSAGGFGQLLETPVVYESATSYVQIFGEEPRWVSFEPGEVIGKDLERLREVVLTSPLLLPDLIGQSNYPGEVTSPMVGSIDPATAVPSDPILEATLDALGVGLGVETIEVAVDIDESHVSHIEYSFRFPVVAGAKPHFTVTVTVEVRATDEASIEVPSDDEVRPFSSLVD